MRLKVFLIVGGTNGVDTEWQSTELLVENDTKWTYAGLLPPYIGRAGAAVSFNNRIIYTGKIKHLSNDMILTP